MKYLCLACGDESAREALTEELGWYVVVRPIFVPELEALEAG